MRNLNNLFVEFGVSTISGLLIAIGNRIDWYTEMLYDDPWNTWATAGKKHYEQLYDEIESLFHSNGVDNDIDLFR